MRFIVLKIEEAKIFKITTHFRWQRGRDRSLLEERLDEMGKKGIKVKGGPTLAQAIHALEPRAETT